MYLLSWQLWQKETLVWTRTCLVVCAGGWSQMMGGRFCNLDEKQYSNSCLLACGPPMTSLDWRDAVAFPLASHLLLLLASVHGPYQDFIPSPCFMEKANSAFQGLAVRKRRPVSVFWNCIQNCLCSVLLLEGTIWHKSFFLPRILSHFQCWFWSHSRD